jgi:hypothetical protein
MLIAGIISEVLWMDLTVAILGQEGVMRSTFSRGDDSLTVTKYSIIGGGGLLIIVGLLLLIFGILALARRQKSTARAAS